MTTLYFVEATEINDGERFDLFVEALNPDEAVNLWRKYYDPDGIYEIMVFKVPDEIAGTPHYIQWHVEDGVMAVTSFETRTF